MQPGGGAGVCTLARLWRRLLQHTDLLHSGRHLLEPVGARLCTVQVFSGKERGFVNLHFVKKFFALIYFQSIACSAAFYYSASVDLYVQLAILAVTATLGTWTFVHVEWQLRAKWLER